MTDKGSDISHTAAVTQPTVADIMRRDPITTSPHATLAAAQALMQREDMRQLPVIENGALIGILSERDLHAHSGYLERTKVDAAMTASVLTLAPGDSAADATRALIAHKINALPVVANGQLVGIVSRTDLLRLLVRVLDESPPKRPAR